MSRAPSDKTKLKQSRYELLITKEQLRDTSVRCEQYLQRALAAEYELTEWKARFDKMLEFRRENGGAA